MKTAIFPSIENETPMRVYQQSSNAVNIVAPVQRTATSVQVRTKFLEVSALYLCQPGTISSPDYHIQGFTEKNKKEISHAR